MIIIEVHGGLKEPAYIKYFQHFTCQNRLPMDTKIISLVSQVELFVRCLFHSFCVLFNSLIDFPFCNYPTSLVCSLSLEWCYSFVVLPSPKCVVLISQVELFVWCLFKSFCVSFNSLIDFSFCNYTTSLVCSLSPEWSYSFVVLPSPKCVVLVSQLELFVQCLFHSFCVSFNSLIDFSFCNYPTLLVCCLSI